MIWGGQQKNKALAWQTAKQNYCLNGNWTENVWQIASEASEEKRKSKLLK